MNESTRSPGGSPGKRIPSGGNCFRATLLVAGAAGLCLVLALLAVILAGGGGRVQRGAAAFVAALRGAGPATEPEIIERVIEVEVEVEKIVEVERKEPLPDRFLARRVIDTAELWNGLEVQAAVVSGEGKETATSELARGESFQLQLQIAATVPKPASSLAELERLNPELPRMLPDLGRMMETARVSPFYHALYEAKARRVTQHLARLDRVLSRHNWFDCETVLELAHPDSGQRALWIQSEMDVVSDGSDGDRWPDLDDYISMSANYRYSTSYAWPKKTATPNPILGRKEAELKAKEERFAVPGLSMEENRELRADIERLTREVAELKARSFLIAEADPFIVVPLSMLGRASETPFGPMIGDYAVVLHGSAAYPAIVGDAGPTFQAGEASLRLAKQINERAGVYSRPVSDLTVSYLVFPQSAPETRDAPDLERWRAECQRLIDGLGGLGEGYALHHWDDLIAAKRGEMAPVVPAAPPDQGPDESAADPAGPEGTSPADPPAARPRPVRPLDAAPQP